MKTMLHVMPFAISFIGLPLVWLGAINGGPWLALIPLYGWWTIPVVDALVGQNNENPDTEGSEPRLFWFQLITLIWLPMQLAVLFLALWYVNVSGHLSLREQIYLFAGIGVLTGSIGINFSHELMHQSSRLERWSADLLLASVLYGHFRSEHLLVHHTHVGTPRDAVTANYGEGFWRFFARVLPGSFRSALRAEAERLKKRNKSPASFSNPFWRYGLLQLAMLLTAFAIGGWTGVGLFCVQAFVAVFQLELINYIEHYGLTRQLLDNGKFEPVRPRHSWNATQKASNWYLLNLQRHSDHHYKPTRPYPLLQTYPTEEAPLLPAGYPVMTLIALVPPLFHRIMNPRVRAWRKQHYPDVTDWPKMVRP